MNVERRRAVKNKVCAVQTQNQILLYIEGTVCGRANAEY